MSLLLDPLAKIELDDAIEWYEIEKVGLGVKFKAEIDAAFSRILRWPTWSINISPNVYRIRVKIFPYKVLYSLIGDDIVILAISHNHRQPNYWIGRRI